MQVSVAQQPSFPGGTAWINVTWSSITCPSLVGAKLCSHGVADLSDRIALTYQVPRNKNINSKHPIKYLFVSQAAPGTWQGGQGSYLFWVPNLRSTIRASYLRLSMNPAVVGIWNAVDGCHIVAAALFLSLRELCTLMRGADMTADTINTAVLAGLQPLTTYDTSLAAQAWTYHPDGNLFGPMKMLPAAMATPGASNAKFTVIQSVIRMLGGLAPQPAVEQVVQAVVNEINAAKAAKAPYQAFLLDGDVSYARGESWQWAAFFNQLKGILTSTAALYTPGNHESDGPKLSQRAPFASGVDSGGECSIPYRKLTRMPQPAGPDSDYYSWEAGTVHFLHFSSEQTFSKGSQQYNWIRQDLRSVNRTITPWVVISMHRPIYGDAPDKGDQDVARLLQQELEPLLVAQQVDLVLTGHLHSYQRSCPVMKGTCVGYNDDKTAKAPVHLLFGNAGFHMPMSTYQSAPVWLVKGHFGYGFSTLAATRTSINIKSHAINGTVVDSLLLTKPNNWRPKRSAAQALYRTTPATANPPRTLSLFRTGAQIVTGLVTYVAVNPNNTYLTSHFGPGTIVYDLINAPPGQPVRFLTGTDEHGEKIALAAAARGLSPQAHCDTIVQEYKALWSQLDISYDGFVRTTDPHHEALVSEVLQRVWDQGDIYKAAYSGWYCVDCEEYKDEKEMDAEHNCPTHRRPCAHREEENYFFALSKYQVMLEQLLESNESFVQPASRRNEVLGWVKEGVRDFSISRSAVQWGIPMKQDPAHTQVFGHGFLTKDGLKMGKALGNTLDPVALVANYGSDAVRLFFMKEVAFGQDGNFSEQAFRDTVNATLANSVGNMLNRTLGLLRKNCDGKLPCSATFKKGTEDEKQQARKVLVAVLETARILAVALSPVTPGLSGRVYHQLGLGEGPLQGRC
eukprot:gene3562-3830_t